MRVMGGSGTEMATLSVLVVDDEPEIADLISTYLERVDEGLAVTAVTRVDVGLERVRGDQYDGVVSDYHMPSMDGLAFLDRVAEIEPSATRILYSSDDAANVVRAASEAGVEFVQKRMRRERYKRIATHIRRSTRTD